MVFDPVPDQYLEDAPDHRFGACLVARGVRGSTVFAYVFGPWQSEPGMDALERLRPGQELLVLLMPDDSLRSGRFPLLGVEREFARERWPMPEFSMHMGGDNDAWALRTSDDQPFDAIAKRPITAAEARALPQWAISAYAQFFRKLADPGAPVLRLSDLYGKAKPGPFSNARELQVDFVVPRDAQRLVKQLRDTLESNGWAVSTHASVGDDPASLWVSGTRRLIGLSAPENLDQDMEAIAAALPSVEYDGHGVRLASE